jgi:hypothetical protein
MTERIGSPNMLHQRGTTYREPATTRELELWAEPALPVRVQSGRDWIAAFVRAARQTLSPAAVREFFRELDANDRVLSRLGWALLAAVPVFAALAVIYSGTATPGSVAGVNPLGVNPWIKPIKFSLSFSTYVSTISVLLLALQIPRWQLTLVRRAIAVSVALEIFSLSMQAWRSAWPHAASSLLDGPLAQLTNGMVMVNTAIVCWMLALFYANRIHTDKVDRPMLAAIRYSIVIFLAGNAIGGYMLARGSHTVGAADNAGPGLPFVNWSTIAGDLRIAHFIAIHAIQIVPLFAYVLSQMEPIPAVRRRKLAVVVLSLLVGGVVGATFVQAAMGRPLIPWPH